MHARGHTAPNALSAHEALRKMERGLLSSEELVRACLQRIEETDAQIGAWAHLDAEAALAQAREMDATGAPVGPPARCTESRWV